MANGDERGLCMIKKPVFLLVLLLGTLIGKLIAEESLWSVRMAESVMTRHPSGYGNWDYVTGTVLRGFEELWRVTGDERYFDYIQKTVDRAVTASGSIFGYQMSDYNLDQIKEGCNCLFLYQQTGEEKYKKAADLLRTQLKNHPRTHEGGFWHKQRYPWQMWLDGLYMGGPFYAQYCVMFDDSAGLNDAINQFIFMENHARDPDTGLLYHGWDESKAQSWANPETGCSPSFWGRAVGWYAMALVDVLDFVPEDHEKRSTLVQIFQRLSEAMAQVQDTSGVWWQVLDQGNREGNYLESSVSCMMVYALAKGVRKGYLDGSWREIAERAYQGVLKHFIVESANGPVSLIQTCLTAGLGNGRDGSYDYYVNQTSISTNDGKGVGPFITASVEIERMQTEVPSENRLNPESIQLNSYPNPFNSQTTVIVSVPESGLVDLTVFNLMGKAVKEWKGKSLGAGTIRFLFDASILPGGLYIAQLIFNSSRITHSMIYLK
jgi:unsaturated rhamnogalacturonyl hydrolase